MQKKVGGTKMFAMVLSVLLAAILLFSVVGTALGGEGGKLSSEDGYVQHIRLEVRMDQSVGIVDTATGTLDVFIQTIEGPVYDGISDEWKAQLKVLENYRSYNNLFFNPATTGGYAEVDTNNDGDLDYFNPWAIREIRYATNFLINREHVVEEIYDGYAIAQYAAIGQRNIYWDIYFQPLIDARGISYSGNFDTVCDMIQDAMTDAMNHPDLEGDLRPPADSPTDYWQYRTPGGEWKDVETEGLIRTDDRRLRIGRWFSDRLEECGIKVHRHEGGRELVDIWLFTDAAYMEWGFYTGGWINSPAWAYQHNLCAQMYTHYYPYMPGDYYQMYIDIDARYSWSKDHPAAEELYDLATPLMTGQLPDEDAYWEALQELLDRGVHESIRVFISTPMDVILLNRENVVEVIGDRVVGWSDILSPRTIKTIDGDFTFAYCPGMPVMDYWNEIGGFKYDYNLMQARITRDFATATNPVKGVPMGMRAEWTEVHRDYEFDEHGELIRNLTVPADAVNYDVFDEEWYEVGSDVKAATAVEYGWYFGTWHTGHEFTMQDLVAWYGFSKQLCWETDAGQRYFVGAWVQRQTYYNNIVGIVFDEAEGTITIYGDFHSPMDGVIADYYAWMPDVPWQQYEAVSQMILDEDGEMTELAPDDTYLGYSYSWSEVAGANTVHWLSEAQGVDYSATLANMADVEFVPPYLQAGRNSPIPLSPGGDSGDIELMRAFYDEHDHFWITHGPFKLVSHDSANLVIEYERWTQEDGYPFPDDHWRRKLTEARLMLGSINAPRNVVPGDPISLSVRARVVEEYPYHVIRSLRDTDDHSVIATLFKGNETFFETTDVELVDSEFRLTIPGDNTYDLEPGTYGARIRVYFDDLPVDAITEVTVLKIYDEPPPPEPMPVPKGVENITLDVVPRAGDAPLPVTIEVGATNLGNESAELDIYVNGVQRYTLNIPANDTATEVWTQTFDTSGEFLIQVGELYAVVEVTEEEAPPPKNDTPGFAFLSLTVGITLSLFAYSVKKIKLGR